ncbi:glycosyltransferase involved in cell wall biosynthesis [Dysgonomonas alginatilytica]|uniref:Glycosyltransferase involved in cell wall biosynthesis n=1 Tax=Dysgonomonas alginatilytica TaxID=1605892 RepID=A0A2V3PMQ6_9BACT|nr:glycosyltransferase [Dysgonomonas alginatilytica]PXV62844.1 glycosyltransferase involved in cell wall biosynthesis [Dysgonomonas alginatilytica]
MKIAILSPFYPYRGGIASFSNRLYQELEETESIEVSAFSFSLLYPSFLFPGKTQYVEGEDFASSIQSERILNSVNPFSWLSTAEAINKYNPDVVIIAYWMPFVAPALGTVCHLLDNKIKIVSLIHNAIPHEKRFFDKVFAKYFFKKCDSFIVLSEPVKDDLGNLISQPKVMVTPHPIYDHYKERIDKSEACKLLHVDADKKNLLFFGLIRDYKGLDLLIESMSYLDDSYQLIIAGECYGDFQKYQQLIDQSPFKENIKVFEQYIPDDMVTTLFSAADVLVLPYRDATQSGVVAVAYQMELPMIATNVGALGETILSSATGIVVEVSPKAISEGIKSYFENGKQAYLNNVRTEKKRLSWSKFVEHLVKFNFDLD